MEVNLRTAPARAGVAHGPEVLVHPHLRDLVVGDQALPDRVRLVVARDPGLAREHGGEELLRRQPPHVGQERPRERDGLRLEVVAEREIAEHLEEGMVSQ